MDHTTTPRRDTLTNVAMVLGSLLLAATTLALSGGEGRVDDSAHLEAILSDHSVATLTSARAEIGDHPDRRLVEQLRKAQRKEAGGLLASLDERGPAPRSHRAPVLAHV